MKLGGEVGRRLFCSSGAGEGNLHYVEAPNGPRHGKVHLSDLAYEALQLLDGYTPLAIGYPQKGYYLNVLLGRQGKGNPVGVDQPSQDLLDSSTVPVHGKILFRTAKSFTSPSKEGNISLGSGC